MLSPQGLVRILQYPPPRQAVLPHYVFIFLAGEHLNEDIPRDSPTGRWMLGQNTNHNLNNFIVGKAKYHAMTLNQTQVLADQIIIESLEGLVCSSPNV